MALKVNMNYDQILSQMNKQTVVLYNRILDAFIYVGEEFVINARGQMQDHAMGTYKDVTTNLRNSIGYFVYHDGKLMKENMIGNIDENRKEIADLVKKQGFQLIGIAGMNYASYVESKGYNVISYQSDICIVDLSTLLETIENH